MRGQEYGGALRGIPWSRAKLFTGAENHLSIHSVVIQVVTVAVGQTKLKQTWTIKMSNHPTQNALQPGHSEHPKPGLARQAIALLILPLTLLLMAGCAENPKMSKSEMAGFSDGKSSAMATNSDLIVLHEGDTLNITFPGSPELNTTGAVIRRDGRITLKSLGEFKAAGLTPPEMEKELIKTFGSQIQTKEVSVAVQSSAFPVYVTGAVLRPGKILSDRPITALEAIMEAGGFDYTKANLKSVRVLRNENGQSRHYTLNFKPVLKGESGEQFHLRPSDIVYVPERFTWF